MIERRAFLARLGKLWATTPFLGSSAAACAADEAFVTPEMFGGRGDGASDDTRALQACIDAAGVDGIIKLKRDAIYRVDTNWAPTWGEFGGIKLRRGQVLDMNGATLRALPTSVGRGCLVQAMDTDGWQIVGPGKIIGEKSIHRGSGGEWGMGVAAFSAADWRIGGGLEVSDCWGDGIYVSAQGKSGRPGSDFVIEDVRVSFCRRNGISIIAGHNGEIRRFEIHDIAGTNPQGGIDLEPDDPRHPNRNIRIRSGRIRNVQVGVYVVLANEDVLITGMNIEAENSGILVGGQASRITIADNPSIANRIGGAEGGAIRTVADPRGVRSLHIKRNVLRGGGGFVIDVSGMGYVDFQVSQNRLFASNPGVQGLARLGTGTFTNNIGVIEPAAGIEGEYYVLFDQVRYGGNSYQNRSRHSMYKNVRNDSMEIAPERYSGPLKR
jgi:hypothetical protein